MPSFSASSLSCFSVSSAFSVSTTTKPRISLFDANCSSLLSKLGRQCRQTGGFGGKRIALALQRLLVTGATSRQLIDIARTHGDIVTLVGFGSFYVGKRAARTGRNPKTGQVISIKASKSPKFRAGKALKDALN